MADQHWDRQLLALLKRAGDDLKKTGEELRGEATRLLKEVQDPKNQQRVKDNLQELGTWARKTATEAAAMIEAAVKRAESGFTKSASGGARRTPDDVGASNTTSADTKTSSRSPVMPSDPPSAASRSRKPSAKAPAKAASKSSSATKSPPSKGAAPKKTLGRKKS